MDRAVTSKSASQIDAVAADWVARADWAPLTPEESAELDAWLSQDPRNFGAYARARAVFKHLDIASGLAGSASAPPIDASPTRRGPGRFFIWASSAAAAVVVAIAVWMLDTSSKPVELATTIGQTQRVALADGSIVTLDTGTALSVALGADERHIYLRSGQALFDVAKDKARPFIVETMNTRVRAVGTSFTVRQAPQSAVEVLVREGVVEVRGTPQAATDVPVRLEANMRAVLQANAQAQVAPVTPEELARRLAWTDGMISFRGETLRQAADEFTRYSKTRITLADEAVAGRAVVGRFAANDPEGFARAVAASLDLDVTVSPGEVRLATAERGN